MEDRDVVHRALRALRSLTYLSFQELVTSHQLLPPKPCNTDIETQYLILQLQYTLHLAANLEGVGVLRP